MRATLTSSLLLLLAAGCHGDRAPAPSGSALGHDRPTANLVLSDHPHATLLAIGGFPRHTWPSTDVGYRLSEITFYDTFASDAQYWYTPRSGYTWRVGQSQQSGVMARP